MAQAFSRGKVSYSFFFPPHIYFGQGTAAEKSLLHKKVGHRKTAPVIFCIENSYHGPAHTMYNTRDGQDTHTLDVFHMAVEPSHSETKAFTPQRRFSSEREDSCCGNPDFFSPPYSFCLHCSDISRSPTAMEPIMKFSV